MTPRSKLVLTHFVDWCRVRGSSAFTLLELLVSLALIAILSALLLSTFSRSIGLAKGISCHANLRQWGIATHLYTMENDDYLPMDGSPNGRSLHNGWYIDLPKQIHLPPYHSRPWHTNAAVPLPKSTWLCPANPRRSNGKNLFHYCLNRHISGDGSGKSSRITSLKDHSKLVWIFDNGKLAAVAQQNNVHPNLHRQGANFLFLDGHSQNFHNREYWDFHSNKGRTNSPSILWQPR